MKLLWFMICLTVVAWMLALDVQPVHGPGYSVDPKVVVLLIGALPGLIHVLGNPHRRRRRSAPLKKSRRSEEPDLDRVIRNQPWYRALKMLSDTPGDVPKSLRRERQPKD